MILPDDPWKIKWDMMMSILIIWSCIGSPLRLAFAENDQNVAWSIAEFVTDAFFFVDIIITFRSAYFNSVQQLIDNIREIQCHYVKFWFWIDFGAILPIGAILESSSNPNSLIRITRISRLYKLLRLIKLLRVMRLFQEKKKHRRFINKVLKYKLGIQRLLMLGIFTLLLCHMSSCIWYFLALNGNGLDEDSWVVRYGYQDADTSRIYLIGIYFTITTITTVGYGDLSAGNPQERIYCLCLMLIGVVGYSFVIGSLTGIIQNIDKDAAKLKQKLDTLSNIRAEYNINFALYWRLRRSLYYDELNEMEEKQIFLAGLPTSLRVELSQEMFKKTLSNIMFFQNKSPFFIAAVAPKLKRLMLDKNEYFFKQDSPIDGGEVAYVAKVHNDDIEFAEHQRGSFFGHLDFFKPRRSFTIKAKLNCSTMFLSKAELFSIGAEHTNTMSELFLESGQDIEKIKEMRDKAIDWYYEEHPELSRQDKLESGELKTKMEIERYSEMILARANSSEENKPQSVSNADLLAKLEEVLNELKKS